MIAVELTNYRAIRKGHWTALPGLNLLIGPNGSGKSTLIGALKFLRTAFNRDLAVALRSPYPGGAIKHWGAAPEDTVDVTLTVDSARWHLRLNPSGNGTGQALVEESVYSGDRLVLTRNPILGLQAPGLSESTHLMSPRSALRTLSELHPNEPGLKELAHLMERLVILHDPDVVQLRDGSPRRENRGLSSRGGNALTLLLEWSIARADRHRFDFVVSALSAAFPRLVRELGFETRADWVGAEVFRGDDGPGSPLAQEANGVVAMLMTLTALAAAAPGGLVVIDEPENSLHPFAIRELVRQTSTWAEAQQLVVLYTTHSPVLLNELTGSPERICVVSRETHHAPTPLPELRNPEWLDRFRLGDLLMDDDFGANDA
jgi:predicted ATPase